MSIYLVLVLVPVLLPSTVITDATARTRPGARRPGGGRNALRQRLLVVIHIVKTTLYTVIQMIEIMIDIIVYSILRD